MNMTNDEFVKERKERVNVFAWCTDVSILLLVHYAKGCSCAICNSAVIIIVVIQV